MVERRASLRRGALLLAVVLAASASACACAGQQAGSTEGSFHPDGFSAAPSSGDLYDPEPAGDRRRPSSRNPHLRHVVTIVRNGDGPSPRS